MRLSCELGSQTPQLAFWFTACTASSVDPCTSGSHTDNCRTGSPVQGPQGAGVAVQQALHQSAIFLGLAHVVLTRAAALPCLQVYDARVHQQTLDPFLTFSQRFAKIKSKRLQQAVAGSSMRPDPELVFGELCTDLSFALMEWMSCELGGSAAPSNRCCPQVSSQCLGPAAQQLYLAGRLSKGCFLVRPVC